MYRVVRNNKHEMIVTDSVDEAMAVADKSSRLGATSQVLQNGVAIATFMFGIKIN